MLSDRGSFSCFFRHSTEAAPSFLYEVLGNANIYEVPKNENPQPAMGKLVGEIMIDFASIRKYPIVNYNGYSSKA